MEFTTYYLLSVLIATVLSWVAVYQTYLFDIQQTERNKRYLYRQSYEPTLTKFVVLLYIIGALLPILNNIISLGILFYTIGILAHIVYIKLDVPLIKQK